jgi:hypothetical protein
MWLLSRQLRGNIKRRTKTRRERRANPLSRLFHPLRHSRPGLGRRPGERDAIEGFWQMMLRILP